MTPKILFRVLAIAEAITWTLLIAGMLIKYVFDGGGWGVSLGGGLHGFVFIGYCITVVIVAVNQRWRAGTIALGLISAIIPFATIVFDVWADRTGRLDGAWKSLPSDDPRDNNLPNRVLQLVLARPWISVVSIAILVAVVFIALLTVGPPKI